MGKLLVNANNNDSAEFNMASKKPSSFEVNKYLTMQEVLEMLKISRMHCTDLERLVNSQNRLWNHQSDGEQRILKRLWISKSSE